MSNKNNTINIDALHYDAHNFNAHTEQGRALLKKSVTENGFGRSIVVDRDNNIIAGNGIVEAAKSLNKKNIRIIDTTGDELVVVRRTDLDIDSEEVRRLALADNATSAVNLAWNYDELEKAREAWNVKPDDWGVKMLPKSKNVVSECGVSNIEGVERIFNLGDVYQIGQHRLMCGDSTDKDCVNKLMDGVEKCDICFTSPPYNIGKAPKDKGKYINEDNRTNNEYERLLIGSLENALEYARYVFYNLQSISSNKLSLIKLQYLFRDRYCDTMIWDKMSAEPAMAKNVLNSQFEYIYIFSKSSNTRAVGTNVFRGNISNIVQIPKQRSNEYSGIHKATMPIDLALYMIEKFANKAVYEPFAGCGTTLLACESLGKSC